MPDLPQKKFGLALGGGGSRALTHLGVLSVLAEAGIRIDCIAGSSMGAILGAMYAFEPDATVIRERAFRYFQGSTLFGSDRRPAKNDGIGQRLDLVGKLRKVLFSTFLANNLVWRRSLYFSHPLLRFMPHYGNPAKAAVENLIPDATIESARIPFTCVALELTQGKLCTFASGPARPPLIAGTAVGVVLPPHEWDGLLYVDAAPVSAVPVRAVRSLGAEVVMAVDVRTPLAPWPEIMNGFDVISRIESVESDALNSAEAASAELLLKPDVGETFWGDFTNLAPVIAAGEAAMRERLPALQKLLAG